MREMLYILVGIGTGVVSTTIVQSSIVNIAGTLAGAKG